MTPECVSRKSSARGDNKKSIEEHRTYVSIKTNFYDIKLNTFIGIYSRKYVTR